MARIVGELATPVNPRRIGFAPAPPRSCPGYTDDPATARYNDGVEEHARRLFIAYGDHCGWKSWDGRPMPRWSVADYPEGTPAEARPEVGDAVRSHWKAAAAASLVPALAALEGLYGEVKQGGLPNTAEGTLWPLTRAETNLVLSALGELHWRLGAGGLDAPKPVLVVPVEERLQADEWRVLHDLLCRARHQLLADTVAITEGRPVETVRQLAGAYDFLAKVAMVTYLRGGNTSGGGGARSG